MWFRLLSHPPSDARFLHSIPTRRSSDLGGKLKSCLYRVAEDADHRFALYVNSSLGGHNTPSEELTYSAKRWSARSEEHTSELQSRLHPLCRLRLEKKKYKHKNL